MLASTLPCGEFHVRCTPGDISSLISELKACRSTVDLDRGKRAHALAAKNGDDSNVFLASALVSMYCRCGSIDAARMVFEGMEERDVVAWNALMFGYAANGQGEVTLLLFTCMQAHGLSPNARSFVAALKGCASAGMNQKEPDMLKTGMALHSQLAWHGLQSNSFVSSTLLDMYAKCCSMYDARRVFNEAQQPADVVSWTALMLGYADVGQGEAALQMFAFMRRVASLLPDAFTLLAVIKASTSCGMNVEPRILHYGFAAHVETEQALTRDKLLAENALIDMYSNCGYTMAARRIFDKMAHRDVISWTAMVQGYACNGEGKAGLDLFACMQIHKGCQPNSRTYVAVLKACSLEANLEIGRQVHDEICKRGFQTEELVACSLVSFYGKCGSMEDAQQVFDSLPSKDHITWTALMAGYTSQGDVQRVLGLFHYMVDAKLKPDSATFTSVLSACNHAGLVNLGEEYFESMRSKHGVNPTLEHYNCMVDMLGRANRFQDAVALAKCMPFQADAVVWKALLGACIKYKNIEVGGLAFQSLLRLEDGDQDATAFVLMSNICQP